MAADDLNRAKYSGLDFATHTDDLLARLQVKFASDFNDFAVSSLGIMLMDLTSFGLDTLSFYLDRRATDTYLSTARTPKAVGRATRQVGYKMGGAVSSSTNLVVRVTDAKTFSVTVPTGFQFQGPNDLIFEAARDVVFTPAEQTAGTSKLIPVFEGETIQEQFVSNGQPNQVFELRRVPEDKSVVQGTVTVTVDGAEFDEVDLIQFGATDQYEVGFNDEPATVRFGDSISGNIPVLDGTIDVEYVASRGLSGQVAAGTITEVVAPLVIAFEQIGLSINNDLPSVGGDDVESLSRAKALAPLVYKSRNVAVVGDDYEALAGSYSDPLFGRVAVAKAISSRSAATDLTLQNLLADIDAAVAGFDTVIQAEVANLNAAIVALDAAIAAIVAADTGDTETSLDLTADTIKSAAQLVRNHKNTIDIDVGDITTLVTSGKNEVDLYGPVGSSSQGTITAVSNGGPATVLDGETFVLDDGTNPPTVFEFDTVPDGVTGGNVVVNVSAASSAVDVATAMVGAINGVGGALLLTADNGGGTSTVVSIINDQTGAVGNTIWSDTVAEPTFLISNPVGGAGGTGALTTAEADGIKEFFDRINTEALTISDSAASLDAQTGTILAGTDTVKALVVDLTDIRTAKDAGTTDASTQSAAIQTATDAIDAANTDVTTDVSTATTAIFAHVDGLLAADCQSNLVVVPILTKDAGGFYIAPSTGLIDSLQTYLDERKEVTQTVSVTSGASFLLLAAMTVRVGVTAGFSEAVVKTAVEVAIDGLLRDRAFGEVLYEIDVENAVQSVEGVRFSNVTISAPVSRLDGSGNLVPLDSEVVTKGTVTINTEAVAA